MDVATVVADSTSRGSIQPVYIEKCRSSGVELRIVTPKLTMPTYFASELISVDLNGRHLLVPKDSLFTAEESPKQTNSLLRITD
jgi:hypothetical protein